ncbi:hypothetical protein M8J75_014631 [Diaphorina citri]|nr:hypothetical protein M8J75_014631 [Diaphorina citri]
MCLPQADLRNEILDHISTNTEAHFKSQQIGDPELTVTEKRTIAENILNKGVGLFLSRFGQYLSYEQLEFFQDSPEEDQYIVTHYLQLCRKQNSKLNEKLVRNRRFEAMNQLIKEGSYFSESEMKSRNPLLYEHLIGQYLTPEEREDMDRVDTSNITFVNLLLKQIDKDNEESFKKEQLKSEHMDSNCEYDDLSAKDLSSRRDLNDQTEVEYDTSDEEDDGNKMHHQQQATDDDSNDAALASSSLWGEAMSDQPLSTPVGMERTPWATSSRFTSQPSRPQNFVELSDKERSLLFEEFRTHMLTNFLEGKEKLFDYSKVDSNPAYDNLTEKNQEAEDKYFDEDESSNSEMQVDVETKSKENTSSDDELDTFMNSLKPEILMQDINSKIKRL